MIAKLGLAALVVLVGSETFVVTGAMLWPIVALSHLGSAVQTGAIIAAAVAGLAAGVWIAMHAARAKSETSGF